MEAVLKTNSYSLFFSSKILMLKVTIFVLEIIQPLKDYCNYTEINLRVIKICL